MIVISEAMEMLNTTNNENIIAAFAYLLCSLSNLKLLLNKINELIYFSLYFVIKRKV